MAGPYPPYSERYPSQSAHPTQEAPTASEYPGMLPPPVPYPKRRSWRVLALTLAALVVIAGIGAAIVYGVRSDNAPSNQLTSAGAKTAIQNYLDALGNADVETIARHTLCGMYDAVHDKRSDQALAKLSSDAFRKQFKKAQVTSIDKMVFASPNQAQALFTMRVTPATTAGRERDEQAVAQLLAQDNQILVCSYVMRTATVF
ncbi:hypothetical protein [Mycobacterium sp.]|uniref:Rv0361 family membrane protein n=1 Tax=Mycobacterium sp. TaxID=1785 RepID=UPI002D242D0C|nr:hypothetical protein [Mycobacterium sp.]HZA08540.1 hypothetical protein [Mycobacterium sp.]